MSRNYGVPKRESQVTQQHVYLLCWLSLVLAIGTLSLVMWLR